MLGLQQVRNDENMNEIENDEMLDEYDFSGGVRGKYVDRLNNSNPVVLLEPDVAAVFKDSESVNSTLRGLLPLIDAQAEKIRHR